MATGITKDSRRRILSKAECSASTAWCSALLHMGSGSTSLDAESYDSAVSYQIKPQNMVTHCYRKVKLRTWGRNIFPLATSLPFHSLSNHETSRAQQRSKSNRKSGETDKSIDKTCSVAPKGTHFPNTLC